MSSIARLSAALALLAASTASAQSPRPNDQPGTRWTVDQIKASLAPIRAGARLHPKRWPNGARVAVVLSFDVDNETWAIPDAQINFGALSDYQYGATEGLPRILRLLDAAKLPASFFVPAAADMLDPTILPAIGASGRHEVAMHGWVHEDVRKLNDPAEEERLARLAFDYIKRRTGKAPVGMRTGSWEVSPYTVAIEKKLGLLYDSSMMAMDEPYRILTDGKNSCIVEVPVTWLLDDYPYLNEQGALPSPELIFKTYRDEFDLAYQEGTAVILTFHPQISGRRSRFLYLKQLVDYMRSKPDVWFTTAASLAAYVKAQAD